MFQVVQRFSFGLLACVLVLLPIHAQVAKEVKEGKEAKAPNRNIRFGMPKRDAEKPFADPKMEDHVITRDQYVLSFNGKMNTPNWVSWNLIESDIGNTARGAFEPDPDLPKGFAKVTSATYNGFGFDRGHMCNSKDRSDSKANNDMTFLMTNVVPQSPNNNRKTWEHLEAYCRDLAKQGNELHIVCGPQGTHGEGTSGFMNSIGKGNIRVNVPAFTWKVIMVLPDRKATPDKGTRMIAVVVPNTQTVDEDWTKYVFTVAHVEELTGYIFFPDLPADVAEIIKESLDRVPIAGAAKKKKKTN